MRLLQGRLTQRRLNITRPALEDFAECPGGYPKGFMKYAMDSMGVTDPDKVLHLFGGGVKTGMTIDIRPEMRPTIAADARSVPMPDESVDWIMADPPVTDLLNYALYGVKSPCPTYDEIAAEAARLLRPGGKFGIVDVFVPPDSHGLRRERTYAIINGPGTLVCGWHVLTKQ